MKINYKECNKVETNEVRQKFLKRYKAETFQISKHQKEVDRFFPHKFENLQVAMDGIIFYTNNEILQRERLSNSYKVKSEEKIEKDKNSSNDIEKINENIKMLEKVYAEYKQNINKRKIEDKEI